jgi:hypothetical protein
MTPERIAELRAFAAMPMGERITEILDALEAAHARIAELTGAMDAADARLRDASIRVWGEDCRGCDAPDHMAEAILGLRAAPGAVTLPEPTAADLEPLIDWDLEYNEIRKGSDTCARVAEWFRSRLRLASPERTAKISHHLDWMPIQQTTGYMIAMDALNESQAQCNHSQTLQRLADRGGISWDEALAIVEQRKWRSVPDAKDRLRALLSEVTP